LSLRAEVECNHALSMAQLGHIDAARKTVTDWLARTADDPATAIRCRLRLVQIATSALDAQSALEHALAAQTELISAQRSLPLLEAEALNQSGWALYLNGRNDEAVASYASALKIYAALERRQHPAALAALSNWATAAYAAGDLNRALTLQEEAHSLLVRGKVRANLPPSALLGHATVLAALGRGDRALQQVDRALQLAHESGSAADQIFAWVIQASIQRERGRLEHAERLLSAATAAAELAPDDARVATALRLGEIELALAQARLAPAQQLVGPLVELLEKRGLRTPLLANAMRLQAEILRRQGNQQAALLSARRALQVAREMQGRSSHSVFTGRAALQLGRAYQDGGDMSAARTAAQTAREHLSKTLGDDHPDTKAAQQLAAQ
jgi:tetratricopeptide (TPR) repeat protein